MSEYRQIKKERDIRRSNARRTKNLVRVIREAISEGSRKGFKKTARKLLRSKSKRAGRIAV